MRLINADALKEDFKTRLEKAKNWKENALNNSDDELVIRATATIDFICEVIMTIDYAPTVELFCSYLSDGEVREPCVESPCKHERPQGEWIVTRHKDLLGRWNSWNEYKCSACKHSVSQIYEDAHTEYATKYCPNCGADMRGDK